MVSRETKRFLINGKYYRFNRESFNRYFDEYSKSAGISKRALEEQIADRIHVSDAAIHNWRSGSNGPGDLDSIRILSESIYVNDYMIFLKVIEEKAPMKALTEKQVEAVKRIYDAIIDFLEEFRKTDGFSTLWYDYKDQCFRNPTSKVYDYVEAKHNVVQVVYTKEYLYLHDTSIYDELYEYINNVLYDAYNEKVEPQYRSQCFSSDEGAYVFSSFYDYDNALTRINEIIDKYI